jgi:hypothetical protein
MARPWILDIVRTYSDWTACANGAGLAVSDDLSGKPWEWNSAYFSALANYLPALTPAEVDELVLEPIRSFPERLFLDALATFIPNVDDVFFNDRGLSSETAVHVRSALEGLLASSQWRNMVRHPSISIEMHLGPAAAAVFFNSQGFGQPAAAYLNSKGIDKLEPFLPLLERLASNAPSPFVAFVTLNLLEVAPRTEHAKLLVSAAKACVATFADDSDFWISYGIGRRVSALIDTILVKSNALFGHILRSDPMYMLFWRPWCASVCPRLPELSARLRPRAATGKEAEARVSVDHGRYLRGGHQSY